MSTLTLETLETAFFLSNQFSRLELDKPFSAWVVEDLPWEPTGQRPACPLTQGRQSLCLGASAGGALKGREGSTTAGFTKDVETSAMQESREGARDGPELKERKGAEVQARAGGEQAELLGEQEEPSGAVWEQDSVLGQLSVAPL